MPERLEQAVACGASDEAYSILEIPRSERGQVADGEPARRSAEPHDYRRLFLGPQRCGHPAGWAGREHAAEYPARGSGRRSPDTIPASAPVRLQAYAHGYKLYLQ